MRRQAVLLLTLLAVLAAGCGDDTPRVPITTPERTGTVLPAAKLPKGWTAVADESGGFTIGLPPGWTARRREGATLIRSADRALAISLTADRSDDGRVMSPRLYAGRTLDGLDGYEDLTREAAQDLRDVGYPAGSASGEGTFEATGVRQSVTVFALRPTSDATFAVVVLRSARVSARRYASTLVRIVRSLRPIAAGDDPGSAPAPDPDGLEDDAP